MYVLFNFPALYQRLPDHQGFDQETLDAVLDELARFCEEEIAPLNRTGDIEMERGCSTRATRPPGLKEAYAKFVACGSPAPCCIARARRTRAT